VPVLCCEYENMRSDYATLSDSRERAEKQKRNEVSIRSVELDQEQAPRDMMDTDRSAWMDTDVSAGMDTDRSAWAVATLLQQTFIKIIDQP
jgi:hypothetical protein